MSLIVHLILLLALPALGVTRRTPAVTARMADALLLLVVPEIDPFYARQEPFPIDCLVA